MRLRIPIFALALSFVLEISGSPVLIGYGEAPPYCYTKPDGTPAGFLIDIFGQAAARERLHLQWVRTRSFDENTRDLAEGRLDILPLSVASEERRRLLFFTKPWWSEETLIVVRADAPNRSATDPSRIALPQLLAEPASKAYAKARRIVVVSAPQALEQVCRGDADAALVGATYIRQLVNARPDACASVRLRISDSPAEVDFSIVSSRRAAGVASGLYRRVVEMTAEGAVATIAARHPPISTPHATRMMQELRARYDQQRIKIVLVTLAIAVAAGVFALLWQVRAKRELRATIRLQAETEQELRESQATLSERTADLIRSNEDLQAFAYSVSHDLQEPVRNQALYSELLDRRYRDRLPEDAKRCLRVIRTSALRTEAMIRSLLAYSSVGQANRMKSQVDCSAVVRRVLDELRFTLNEANASVEVGALPVVWGWEDRLQQVFQNLIENAAKYRHPAKALHIVISSRQNEGEWCFMVSDNGIGVDEAYADRIFGLFKRLHTHDRYEGSGIGLAICKRVVERHGGRIWVESREGEGSTFFFTLRTQTGSPGEICAA